MKFKQIYKTIQNTLALEAESFKKTYPENIRVIDKNGGLICSIDANSDEWLNQNHAYLWESEIKNSDNEFFTDADNNCEIDDWFSIIIDYDSANQCAISELSRYSEYVVMSKLLSELGISQSNYYHFMKGEGMLSLEKASMIINAIKMTPINSTDELTSESIIDQFRFYGKHVNITKLIKNLGIYDSIYHGFMKGKRNINDEDIHKILNSLKSRPITPKV